MVLERLLALSSARAVYTLLILRRDHLLSLSLGIPRGSTSSGSLFGIAAEASQGLRCENATGLASSIDWSRRSSGRADPKANCEVV